MKTLFKTWANKIKSKNLHRTIQVANERYQVCEYKDELWITFDGVRVLPESMLAKDALSTIRDLRKDYIVNHSASAL